MDSDIPIIPFGPDATCTLEVCPIEYSIFQYRPSLAANISFIVLYTILMFIHLWLGLRLGHWWFSGVVIVGCISNVIGYGARVILWQNPFSFNGFLLQIIFVGSAPVFYSAAIYITMTNIVKRLDVSLSRLEPKLYYVIFILSDLGAGTLQASGGAVSTVSSGANAAGVNLALAGLSLQVVSLLVFAGLLADYLIRYFNGKPSDSISRRLKLFVWSLSVAVLLIIARCAYRVAELGEGYTGSLFHDEPLFIALEGVLVVLAVLALSTGHPGLAFNADRGAGAKSCLPVSPPGDGEESGIELLGR